MKVETELLLKILIVALIVSAGLFTFNQIIEWKYKAQLLMGPCQLCVKLNPEVGGCWQMKEAAPFDNLNIIIPDG